MLFGEVDQEVIVFFLQLFKFRRYRFFWSCLRFSISVLSTCSNSSSFFLIATADNSSFPSSVWSNSSFCVLSASAYSCFVCVIVVLSFVWRVGFRVLAKAHLGVSRLWLWPLDGVAWPCWQSPSVLLIPPRSCCGGVVQGWRGLVLKFWHRPPEADVLIL